MPVQVRIPGVLQGLTLGAPEVVAPAGTLAALIDDLEARFPGMRDRLLDDSGLRRYLNIYVNGRNVRLGESLRTVLNEGDAVWILPTSSGGMAAR